MPSTRRLDAPRSNEMAYGRLVLRESADRLLQVAIRSGDPLMLARVLHPRLQVECLQHPAWPLGILVDRPDISAVAPSRLRSWPRIIADQFGEARG